MLSCVIIDDEANCREDLKSLIEYRFKDRLRIAGMGASVQEGVGIINKTMPDVVFLDIRMPVEDGFQLFKKFDQITFEVVFITSYEEFALKAIKHEAFDYLLKPVDPKDLDKLLERFKTKADKTSANNRIKMLLAQLESGSEPNILVSLPVKKEYKVVNARDILYCKADVNYTEIFLADSTKVVVTTTLGKVEGILDYRFFFRCHKSYLVNVNHIDSYNRIDGFIRMKNNEVIYLAGRRIEDFINLFGKMR
ncbi:MAG: LytR/AlgR family response regulator transcription factor [Bacteroidales bacterium]